jgi:ubiquinone/menaquinone biosynthesis C-methylase UbiE
MDIFSSNLMSKLFKNFSSDQNLTIIDVGSADINGCYKSIVPQKWNYIGVDLCKAPNVDLVMPSLYKIPLSDNYADVVISGQTFEHVREPFKLMHEISRIVKSFGTVIIIVPCMFPEHKEQRCPFDYWRIMPDGMKALFEESGLTTIKSIKIETNEQGWFFENILGIAIKKSPNFKFSRYSYSGFII